VQQSCASPRHVHNKLVGGNGFVRVLPRIQLPAVKVAFPPARNGAATQPAEGDAVVLGRRLGFPDVKHRDRAGGGGHLLLLLEAPCKPHLRKAVGAAG
jgi:hypothetical protein